LAPGEFKLSNYIQGTKELP